MRVSPISFGKVIKLKNSIPEKKGIPDDVVNEIVTLANGHAKPTSELTKSLRETFSDRSEGDVRIFNHHGAHNIYLFSGKDSRFLDEKCRQAIVEEVIDIPEAIIDVLLYIEKHLDGVLEISYDDKNV